MNKTEDSAWGWVPVNAGLRQARAAAEGVAARHLSQVGPRVQVGPRAFEDWVFSDDDLQTPGDDHAQVLILSSVEFAARTVHSRVRALEKPSLFSRLRNAIQVQMRQLMDERIGDLEDRFAQHLREIRNRESEAERARELCADGAFGALLDKFSLRSPREDIACVVAKHPQLAALLAHASEAIAASFGGARAALELDDNHLFICIPTRMDVEPATLVLRAFEESEWLARKGRLPVTVTLDFVE